MGDISDGRHDHRGHHDACHPLEREHDGAGRGLQGAWQELDAHHGCQGVQPGPYAQGEGLRPPSEDVGQVQGQAAWQGRDGGDVAEQA